MDQHVNHGGVKMASVRVWLYVMMIVLVLVLQTGGVLKNCGCMFGERSSYRRVPFADGILPSSSLSVI